jgi:SAM-dependent methyltransferase
MSLDHRCPVCGKAFIQQTDHDYLLCKTCGIVKNAAYTPVPYSASYFDEEYKEQYGKTYLDDFSMIYGLSLNRLTTFQSLFDVISFKDMSLLDVGCAMGFFLKAAVDRGFHHCEGVEISSYASDFVKERFHLDVFNSSFDKTEIDKKYNVISSWFFVEHTPDPVETIRKMYSLLSEDGFLLLSLPSCFGPLFTFHRDDFFKTHPGDHSYDFSPSSIRKILKGIGFKKVFVLPASYHPERIVKKTKFFFPLFAKVYSLIAKFTGFGDTIEVYAQR